ncbi:MAG: diguanylate cyclase [Pseudomonadota bacterium]
MLSDSSPGNNPFSRRFVALLGVIGAMALAFLAYVWLESQVDEANARRQNSLSLMEELRQSSDDLTRMAQAYVMTGEQRFIGYFDAILAIREGTLARPQRYHDVYWDLVAADDRAPRPGSAQWAPLMELMRQARFSDAELARLAQSKSLSDALTETERLAMRLAAQGGAQREQGSALLFDQHYRSVKAQIMRPIDDTFVAVSERTRGEVANAQWQARAMRVAVVLLGLLALCMTRRIYAVMLATLGGTLAEICQRIAAPGDSVMACLERMQADLRASDSARQHATAQQQQSLERLTKIASMVPGMVYVFQLRPDGSTCFPYASEGIGALFGLTPEAVRADAAPLLALVHKDDRERVCASSAVSASTLSPWSQEYRIVLPGGQSRWMFGNSTPEQQADGSLFWYGVVTDISERKRADEELRIAAIAFESQEGMLVTDAQGIVLRANQAACRISGRKLALLVGAPAQQLYADGAATDRALKAAMAGPGKWQGEIMHRRPAGADYPAFTTITAVLGAGAATTHIVHSFIDNSEHRAKQELIRQLAFYDALTQLPNRRLLMDRLNHALHASGRSARHGAVCFIDLDQFKGLNDRHGHDSGDALLCEVARRLAGCVRAGDTVARLGGDEFVLVLENLGAASEVAQAQAQRIAHNVLAALALPYVMGELAWRCSASVGVTMFKGHGEQADTLLKRADLAMYRAKHGGRNASCLFEEAVAG